MADEPTSSDLAAKVAAEAYVVIGHLATFSGTFDHPEVKRALDHFGDLKTDQVLLPWGMYVPTDTCQSHKELGIYLDPCCPHCTDPEAQKGEPVAWRFKWPNGSSTRPYGWLFSRKAAVEVETMGYEVSPVFDRPAPSSELLEALKIATEALENTEYMLKCIGHSMPHVTQALARIKEVG